jgi:hypothetical protein
MVPMGLLRGYWQRVMGVCTGKRDPLSARQELTNQRSNDHSMLEGDDLSVD